MSQTESRTEQWKQKIQTLRDQIKVDLKLASMDLRDEWQEIEKKIPDPAQVMSDVRETAGEVLERIADQLMDFRQKLRDRMTKAKD
jgi:hypothetical protein